MYANTSLMLLALATGCAVSDHADDHAPAGGKADDASDAVRGLWRHFVYKDGRIAQSGNALFTLDGSHLRLRIGAFDHDAGTEGELVYEPFALAGGFAEIVVSADCTLLFALENGALEILQAGACAGVVPPTMTLDGTYLRERGLARIDVYRQQIGTLRGTMTLVSSGGRREFAIGVQSDQSPRAAITGVIENVVPGSPAVFSAGADCRLTFTNIGISSDIDRVRVDQFGPCTAYAGGGTLRFSGEWNLNN